MKKVNPVIVRLILDFPGSDCNITDEHSFTPVMHAMDPQPEREGDWNEFIIVKLLLDREDTKLDLMDNYKRTILSFKCHCEGIALFKADPRCTPEILNFKNEDGETFLSSAVKNYDNQSERIINILMKHLFTADHRCTPEIINMKNEYGETALMTAVAYRNT